MVKKTKLNLDQVLMFQDSQMTERGLDGKEKPLTLRSQLVNILGGMQVNKEMKHVAKIYRLHDRIWHQTSPWELEEEQLAELMEILEMAQTKRPAFEGQVMWMLEEAKEKLEVAQSKEIPPEKKQRAAQ